MGKYDKRENYILIYDRLCRELGNTPVENPDTISDFQLVMKIDRMLRKLNLIPFKAYEIDEISSNMN